MSTYLVTGAAGFIAARVCELLLDGGDAVIGVDNLNSAYDVRLKDWRLRRLLARDRFTFVKADIARREAGGGWEAIPGLDTVEAVINLAARAGVRPSVTDPWVYYETNVTGTLNLLELCRQRGIAKFVLASTSSLYGRHNPMPYREDADTSRPLSPYAASKKAAETLCYSYHHLHGLDVTVFRYFTVYGPAGRPDMSLFRFVQWISEGRPLVIFGDGGQSRDFTYVDDIARGTILGLQPLGYDVINLGGDQPLGLLDAVQLVERCVGKPALFEFQPPAPADVRSTWADISRARERLGWQPAVKTEDGIARLVEWYQANRDWARDVDTTP